MTDTINSQEAPMLVHADGTPVVTRVNASVTITADDGITILTSTDETGQYHFDWAGIKDQAGAAQFSRPLAPNVSVCLLLKAAEEDLLSNDAGTLQFTRSEIREMFKSPQVLREIASLHSCQETMADASDWPESAEFHKQRRLVLEAEADRLQAYYES